MGPAQDPATGSNPPSWPAPCRPANHTPKRRARHTPCGRRAFRRTTATAVHKQAKFAEDAVNAALDSVLDDGMPIGQALSDVARLLELRAKR